MTWKDRIGFSRTSGRGTTPVVATKSPLFCFSLRPLSAIYWMLHSCQSTSLYSVTNFCLPVFASSPCCLPHFFRIPTCLLCRGWKVSDAISRPSGWPCRLLRWDHTSGARPYWHRAWGRACCQSLLAKRVVSGLLVCRVCWLLPTLMGYGGVLGGCHCHGTPRGTWR